ncbi:hypothetical protein [Geminocystis sp. NIES-3709]|nr:hypothetical protein [Geminocystis sp. NIES-3709]BAQ65384.1 hypothetical protein GM3709_2149 [Geminocystis sp. NIES-3709]
MRTITHFKTKFRRLQKYFYADLFDRSNPNKSIVIQWLLGLN